MSKPLLIPESKEDHQWRLGGMLQMVTGKETPSTGTTGEGGAAPQVGWQETSRLREVPHGHWRYGMAQLQNRRLENEAFTKALVFCAALLRSVQ